MIDFDLEIDVSVPRLLAGIEVSFKDLLYFQRRLDL